MALSFPDNADSADLAAAGYSQVIILGGGTDTVNTSATADYLILAGGGGGGGVIDGGGGAGGYRTTWGTGADGSGGNSGGLSALETALTLNSGTAYSIAVGQGGEGGNGWNNGNAHRGHKGRTTSISGSDITTVTTTGGGGGHGFATATHTDINGGSGGGGAYAVYTGGTATSGEGFAGGTGTAGNTAAGGGGAGAAGSNSSTSVSGDGGAGLASTITGASITRAGGGGGGIRNVTGTVHGDGGAGGGGDGGVQGNNSYPSLPYGTVTTTSATHGRSKYGGGGGGAGHTNNTTTSAGVIVGGNGGSGIAIFRIPSTVTYSASQLASDVSSLTNCTASYLNTQVYTDDTNFDGVTLLINGTSATEDLSSENQSSLITNNGSVTTTSLTGPSGYGTVTALDLNGSTRYLSTTYYTSSLFNQNFTIEGWFYIDNAVGNRNFFSHRSSNSAYDSVIPYITTSSTYGLVVGNGSAWPINTTGGSVTTGWHHIAVTRNGNDYVLWVDGTSTLTGTYSGTVSASGNFAIGAGSSTTPSQYIDGKVFDFRVTEGVARYTSAFTAPTSAFPDRETSTGGDHVITFTVATEDPYDGATANDGTATWTPTLSTTTPAASTTWTIPEGVDSFSIMAIGAGGAAGYSDSSFAGGGGGGGGLAYLNNIAVTQGDQSVQSITVGGGQLGIGGESDGGDATDLTVIMNLSSDPQVDLAGFNINPYGQVVHDSADSNAKGLLFVGSNKAITSNLFDSSPTLDLSFTDSGLSYASQILYQQPPGPFGEIGAPETGNRLQLYQNIYNNSINSLLIAQNPYDVIHDSADSAASRPDFLGNRSGDSNELTALGQLDSAPEVGTGRVTLFAVVSNFIGTAVQATITNSPYLDSSGGTTIGPSDPNDYRGYGPGTDLEQVIIRSRPGDIIQAST